jgi:glutamine amidotransferase-like uncharacterized protein
MSCRAGFVWGTKQHFNRYIEECGIACELVTPQMLAAPFYRGSFNCLIIPTGFANPAYSNLLPALRAASARIKKFVENGGNLLVFGAAVDRPDAYDWLPFPVAYRHECHPRRIECSLSSDAGTLIDDYNPQCIECDGSFLSHEGTRVGIAELCDVIIEKKVGEGRIVVTSVHEYPSRGFLKNFCSSGKESRF